MTLQCIVRMAHGVKELIDVYFDSTQVKAGCGSIEFALAGQLVKLSNECGLDLGAFSAAVARPVWYDYVHRTVAVVPPLSNGILYTPGQDTVALGTTRCTFSAEATKHAIPVGVDTLWATADAVEGGRIWEGLLDENDAVPGDACVISLFALRGSPGVSASGEFLAILPQTEMQGMLALVCASVAAVYLIGSASLYEQGRTVSDVHGDSKSTKLFLMDGPLTALTASVAALMIGAPENQMPWVQYQRAFLCGSTVILFIAAIYLLYSDAGQSVRATTLRTVIELPLLVAVYSPLASSSSGVVGLSAMLLGIGSVLIAMRVPPVPASADVFDVVAKGLAIWVQAPALLAGVITSLGDDGVSQGVAAVSISLGLCAASMHASTLSPQNTKPPSP